MAARTTAARELLARAVRRARGTLAGSRLPQKVLGTVSGAVLLSLATASGTAALWTGSVTVRPSNITAGSISADITAFAELDHTYTSDTLSRTAGVQLRNTGTVAGSFTTTMSATGSSTMMSNTSLDVWVASGGASCTEWDPIGANGWSGMLSGTATLTGTLPANSTRLVCVRTRLHASQLTTTASVSPKMTLDLVVPNTSWRSSKTVTAAQNVVANNTLATDYTDVVQADGAAHHWRLGEPSGRVFYDWLGTHDAYSGPQVTRGVAGAILGEPNGAAEYSDSPSSSTGTRVASTAPQSFAIEAWFSTTSRSGGKIFGFGNSTSGMSSTFDRHLYMNESGRVSFGVGTDARSILTTTTAYNDGRWHHVVGNLGAGGQELYIDGQLVGRAANTTSSASYSGYWRIGGDNTWAGDEYFDGRIDEVAVYGAPMRGAQVSNHFNISGRGAYPAGAGDQYGSTVYADAPTLFWRLGESTGSTAVDSSGKGHTGAYSGAVTKSVTGAIPGTRNTAVQFNGTNGLVASNTAFANPQTYSLELWFKTTSAAGGKLIGFGDAQTGSSSNYDRHIYLRNDGRVVFGSSAGGMQTVASSAAYNNGQWHHVVATQSSSGMVLYIDGREIGANSATNPMSYSGYWRVGGDNLTSWPDVPTAQHVTAAIDEVAVYSAALSSTKVKTHYAVATGTPIAAFDSSVSAMTASFTAAASSDVDGSITSYSWNWGDNTASGSGATPTHVYATPGTYVVTLTVTDNAGKTSEVSQKVVVSDGSAPATPASPTMSSRTPTSITMSWPATTDNVGVTQYQVFRDGAAVGTTSDLSYTDSSLAAGTSYSFSIRARDAAGNWSARSAATTMTTQYAAITAGSWYGVRNLASSKCVQGMGTASGSQLHQYACATTNTQQFGFVSLGSGYWRVEYRQAPTVVWDLSSAGRVHLYDVHDGTNQQWESIRHGNGSYSFKSVSNPGLCMQFNNGGTEDGAELWPAACNVESNTQRFALEVAP